MKKFKDDIFVIASILFVGFWFLSLLRGGVAFDITRFIMNHRPF